VVKTFPLSPKISPDFPPPYQSSGGKFPLQRGAGGAAASQEKNETQSIEISKLLVPCGSNDPILGAGCILIITNIATEKKKSTETI
jgi:hypothetical protein